MDEWRQFVQSQITSGAKPLENSADPLVAAYTDVKHEYGIVATATGLVDRSYRGLLRATGGDRKSWLHNLTTNHVNTLSSGDGNYSFALNLQGRILFDLNILVGDDNIWVELDRVFLTRAMEHFNKYTIIEDVVVEDASGEYVRLALVGKSAGDLAATLGAAHAVNLPDLGRAEVSCGNATLIMVRNDFCGRFGLELFVPSAEAVKTWQILTDESNPQFAVPVGFDAIQVHRIEAGIPWPGHEITEEYLPAETGQFDRAVSYQKGCYLGQEVVERMRSRDVLARRLVGLRIDGSVIPSAGAQIMNSGKQIGVLTSACQSPACDSIIGLGYIKTAADIAGSRTQVSWDDHTVGTTVADLPMTPTHGAPTASG